MHTLAFATQKGGVGKTSTLVGVTETLVEKGKDVLVVDADAQANASRWLMQEGPHEYGPDATLLHAADPDAPVFGAESLEETDLGADLIPAHPRQNSRLQNLHMESYIDKVLEDLLSSSEKRYDFALIDTPPYIGSPVWAAMSASDHIVVPVQLEGLAIEGLISLRRALSAARERFRTDVDVLGIFANQVDVRRASAQEGWDFLNEEYGDLVFDTRLRQRADVAHASTIKQPLRECGSDHVTEAFDNLTDEILHRLNE
jgi:chromosome partitioning protein